MWSNWKRGQDYYQEGELFWLDADTLIRKLTNNKKSLDDFEAIFLGKGGNTGPLIAPYERPELIADLNQVVAYDWATFIHERIDNINPRADLAGIEQGGYKLVYKDTPSKSEKTLASVGSRRGGGIDVWYSLGLRVNGEGQIADVRWSSPADDAKLAPGQKIYAVNGQTFSGDKLKAAIRNAKGTTEPIHLILEQDGFVTLADLNYHDGERYPVLVRVDGTPDYLDDITKPRTTPVASQVTPLQATNATRRDPLHSRLAIKAPGLLSGAQQLVLSIPEGDLLCTCRRPRAGCPRYLASDSSGLSNQNNPPQCRNG